MGAVRSDITFLKVAQESGKTKNRNFRCAWNPQEVLRGGEREISGHGAQWLLSQCYLGTSPCGIRVKWGGLSRKMDA